MTLCIKQDTAKTRISNHNMTINMDNVQTPHGERKEEKETVQNTINIGRSRS